MFSRRLRIWLHATALVISIGMVSTGWLWNANLGPIALGYAVVGAGCMNMYVAVGMLMRAIFWPNARGLLSERERYWARLIGALMGVSLILQGWLYWIEFSQNTIEGSVITGIGFTMFCTFALQVILAKMLANRQSNYQISIASPD